MVSFMLAAGALAGLFASAFAQVDLPPIPGDKTTPVQQRLALAGPTGTRVSLRGPLLGSNARPAMSVAWNTYQQLSKPCVSYGISSTSLTHTTCGTAADSVTYPTSRTWFNSVLVSGLQPATTYYYQIGSTNATVDSFTTGRPPGDKTPFTIATVVDMGVYGAGGYTITAPAQKRDIPRIAPSLNHTTIGRLAATRGAFDFVLHPGDLAYADDWIETGAYLLDGARAYQSITERFYDQLAAVAARTPYMVSPGNHEAACQEIPYTTGLCPAGQRNFSDFMVRFGRTMPAASASTSTNKTAAALRARAQALARPPFWYSYDYGSLHFVMIDTETDFSNAPDAPGGSAGLNGGPFGTPGQQLAFLAADLASVDRDVTPWVVVAGHRPWYTTGASAGCTPCQQAFEVLFMRYHVDLAVFGHIHNLQRFNPVYAGVADPNGLEDPAAPMYIVAGGAGNIEGFSAITPAPAYTEFAYNTNFGYATLTFRDRNHLDVKFIRSYDGALLDSSTLHKSHTQRFF
jgi:hypothetical protein